MIESADWDLSTLSEAIRTRRVSCREVMTACLDRVAAVNPRHNAIVALCDPATLLDEADARDRELAAGRWHGVLHGVPQAIKDIAPVRGMRTTLGSPLLRDQVPSDDALFVERMRRSGAILIGRTNTPEFGLGSQTFNTVYGATRNAHLPSLTAGGYRRLSAAT